VICPRCKKDSCEHYCDGGAILIPCPRCGVGRTHKDLGMEDMNPITKLELVMLICFGALILILAYYLGWPILVHQWHVIGEYRGWA